MRRDRLPMCDPCHTTTTVAHFLLLDWIWKSATSTSKVYRPQKAFIWVVWCVNMRLNIFAIQETHTTSHLNLLNRGKLPGFMATFMASQRTSEILWRACTKLHRRVGLCPKFYAWVHNQCSTAFHGLHNRHIIRQFLRPYTLIIEATTRHAVNEHIQKRKLVRTFFDSVQRQVCLWMQQTRHQWSSLQITEISTVY
jgi:hypothetical protein